MSGKQDTSTTKPKAPITTKYVSLPPLPAPEDVAKLYERHLLFDNVRTLDRSGPRRPHDRHAILNVAGSGKFSSDRTIAQ